MPAYRTGCRHRPAGSDRRPRSRRAAPAGRCPGISGACAPPAPQRWQLPRVGPWLAPAHRGRSSGSRAASNARRAWPESRAIGTVAGKARISCSGSMSFRSALRRSTAARGRIHLGLAKLGADGEHNVGSAQRLAHRRPGHVLARMQRMAGRQLRPLALTVLITGRPSRSASATTSVAAATAPPPITINGIVAPASGAAARAIAPGSGAGRGAEAAVPAARRRCRRWGSRCAPAAHEQREGPRQHLGQLARAQDGVAEGDARHHGPLRAQLVQPALAHRQLLGAVDAPRSPALGSNHHRLGPWRSGCWSCRGR